MIAAFGADFDRDNVIDSLNKAVRDLECSGTRDSHTYASLLKQCANARALPQGKRVHAHMIKHKCTGDRFVSNLLLHMYGKCGSVDKAYSIFHSMKSKDQFSWNIMLTAYGQNGHLDHARDTFDRMPQRDVASWTAMLVAYARHGRVRDAEAVFHAMPLRSVVSWNAMISAYTRNQCLAEALLLFRFMDMEGVQPDKVSFIASLDACNNIAEARAIHSEVKNLPLLDCIQVVTALVGAYGRYRDVDSARRLFNKVATPDSVLWAAMLSAYAQHGYAQEARQIFDKMPERARGCVSWSIMITAYARGGDINSARHMFDVMPSRSAVAWNAMITAYAQTGQSNTQVIRLFRLMVLEGVEPDSITFSSVIDACSSCNLALGRLIHTILLERGGETINNFVVQTSLVAMYGNYGRVKDAELIFSKLTVSDVKSWTAMVTAYAQGGNTIQAEHLFRLMHLHGHLPSKVTLVSILSICSHAGLLAQAHVYFASLSADYGLVPVMDHFMCMADVLARSGRLAEAHELLATMPFHPDAAAWTSLLRASTAAGDSLRAAGCAKQLDPTTSAPYTLLCNLQT